MRALIINFSRAPINSLLIYFKEHFQKHCTQTSPFKTVCVHYANEYGFVQAHGRTWGGHRLSGVFWPCPPYFLRQDLQWLCSWSCLAELVPTLEGSACLCLQLWSCGCTLPMPGFWHRSYRSEQRPSCLYSKVSYPLRYPLCSWPSLTLISLKSSPPSGLVEQPVSPSPWVACKFRAYLGRRINFKLSLSQNRKEKEAWGSMPIEEHLFGTCESPSFSPQYCKNKVNKCPTL